MISWSAPSIKFKISSYAMDARDNGTLAFDPVTEREEEELFLELLDVIRRVQVQARATTVWNESNWPMMESFLLHVYGRP